MQCLFFSFFRRAFFRQRTDKEIENSSLTLKNTFFFFHQNGGFTLKKLCLQKLLRQNFEPLIKSFVLLCLQLKHEGKKMDAIHNETRVLT